MDEETRTVGWTEEEKELNAEAISVYGEHYAERLFLFAKSVRGKMKAGHKIAATHESECPWETAPCVCDVKFEYCGQTQ